MSNLDFDMKRYGGVKRSRNGGMPKFQYYLRKTQDCNFTPLKIIYKALFAFHRNKNMCEMSDKLDIGPGLYLGHAS